MHVVGYDDDRRSHYRDRMSLLGAIRSTARLSDWTFRHAYFDLLCMRPGAST